MEMALVGVRDFPPPTAPGGRRRRRRAPTRTLSHQRSRVSHVVLAPPQQCKMSDSKIKPQPGEGGGINTNDEKGPGLQKEEPGATIPDRDPGSECVKEKDQVQAEVITTLTFAEACAQPGAKRLMFHGCNGPVNAVEVHGTFFVQNDEAEAKAARSKALELAPEVAVASKAAANPAAAEEEVAAAPTPMPEPAAAHRISYAAVASKSVGPKPSAAGFEPRAVAPSKFSAGPKCSTRPPSRRWSPLRSRYEHICMMMWACT